VAADAALLDKIDTFVADEMEAAVNAADGPPPVAPKRCATPSSHLGLPSPIRCRSAAKQPSATPTPCETP
jgi:hypothetical protein